MLNKTKHTPGPWKAEPNGGDDPDPTKYCITADVLDGDMIGRAEKIWNPNLELYGYWDPVTQEANARLMAKSPEMLEALDMAYRITYKPSDKQMMLIHEHLGELLQEIIEG